MKTILEKQHMVVVALILIIGTTVSFPASATRYGIWCTTWESTYSDAGYGEDILTNPDSTFWPAMYTHARLKKIGDDTPLWEGALDVEGCIPQMQVLQLGAFYEFTQWTYVERGARKIWVNIDESGWGQNSVPTITTVQAPSSMPDNTATSFGIEPAWDNAKSNLMPVIGRLLQKFDTLSYPANTETYIHTDATHCDQEGGAYWLPPSWGGSGTRVCVRAGAAMGWDDVSTWKHIIGHELGHRVAYANGWEAGANYNASGAPTECTCNYVEHGSQLHCLMSREYGDAAQEEGFGHFFAAAMFNDRIENNGKFVYCKESLNQDLDTDNPIHPPSAWNAFVTDNGQWYNKYMSEQCDPGDVARGVELDWLRFYYEMWTTGTYKYSVGELLDIWEVVQDQTPDDYGWDNTDRSVYPSAGDLFSGDKLLLMWNKGVQEGVNHG
jgi:hypothetical protein